MNIDVFVCIHIILCLAKEWQEGKERGGRIRFLLFFRISVHLQE